MKGCLLCVLSAVAGGLDLEWMLTLWNTAHQLSWLGIVLLVGCLIVLWIGCAQGERSIRRLTGSQVESHAWVEADHDDS